MKTIVLGAGIIGISTAWHLLERGHEVVILFETAAALQDFLRFGLILPEVGRGGARREAG